MMIKEQHYPEPGAVERYNRLKQMLEVSDNLTKIGWRVDFERIGYHHAKCGERAAKYKDKFLSLTGLSEKVLGKKGTGQTDAIKKWFWETQMAPIVSRAKNRKKTPQLNSAALVEYATAFGDTSFGPGAAALYSLRKNLKYQTYCDAYRVLAADDGRIHSNFFPFGTKTGRWTSGARKRLEVPKDVNPSGFVSYGCNIQQVPQNEPVFDFGNGPIKLVESLRDIFIADDGCVVGSADFEALELRLIAYIFGVKGLIAQIEQGKDTHWINARALFRELQLPEVYDEKNKKHKACRNAAKTCAYGMSYQYSEPNKEGKYPTVTKTLKGSFPDITEKVVALMANRFFELYPEIRQHQQLVRKTIDEVGYREIPISGRRVYYPSSMRGYNQGINVTFQSTGAELINRATLALYPHCEWQIGGFYILGQIHDELVFNIPNQKIAHYESIITGAMGAPAQFGGITASIPAKLKTGAVWPK